MIEWLLVVAVALAAGVYCTWPLRRGAVLLSSEASASSDAELRRDNALAGLDDLEFDRDAGKLSENDFARLRAQFEAEAVAALDEIERTSGDAGRVAEDPLEAEIASARLALTCANCGSPRPDEGRCPRCGA